jgi:hypothetical protein
MTPHQTRAQRLAMPLAREVVRELAVTNGGCVRPIQLRRTDTQTGQVEQVLVPCGHTLATVCPSCAERAKSQRAAQCREGWHLDHEPAIEPDAADDGITHRLTAPASPTTTGKVERFHLTLRRELLDGHEPFGSVEGAQAALDGWVAEYNADRPHQALDGRFPVTPADRFTPVPPAQRDLVELWLPPALTAVSSTEGSPPPTDTTAAPGRWQGGPVEFDRVVPPSGNMWVAGRQFWLGPARAGIMVRVWAGTQLIHLSAGGARIKTLRSHLSVNDLAKLAATGAVPAGPAPLPPAEDGQAVEVERPVSRGGLVCLGSHRLLAAEILSGQLVGIRIEPATLMFYDPATRVLLRTRPNPLTPAQAARLRGARPAGPPPRPPL